MYFSRVRIRPEIIRSFPLGDLLKESSYEMHRLLWGLFPQQKDRTFLYREEIAKEQLGLLPNVRGEPVYYLVSQTKPIEPEVSLFEVATKDYQPQLYSGQRLAFELRANPVVTKQGKKHDVVMNTQMQFLKQQINGLNLAAKLATKPEKKDYKQLLLDKGGDELALILEQILSNNVHYAERLHQTAHLSERLNWAIKVSVDGALEQWLIRQGEKNYGFEIVKDHNGLSKLQNDAYQWHELTQKRKTKKDRPGFSSIDFTGELQITDVEKFNQAVFSGIGRSKAFGCGMLMIRKIRQ